MLATATSLSLSTGPAGHPLLRRLVVPMPVTVVGNSQLFPSCSLCCRVHATDCLSPPALRLSPIAFF
jgi:hypothetical protein